MSENLLSFVIRVAQVVLVAAPYILYGVVIAGALRVFVGEERIRRLLAGDRISGPIKAFFLSLLCPVCSFGAIPIARELVRAQVPRNTVLVFLLAAPLFHPLTLLYALTAMDLSLLVMLLCCALAVFATASFLVPESAGFQPVAQSLVEPGRAAQGMRRIFAVVVVAAEHLRGPFLAELAVGLLGVGVVGMLLDPAWIGDKLAQYNPWAGAYASGLGSAIYVTPRQAIALLDQMFAHGNSFAAALGLLLFGAGVTWGTFLACGRLLGVRVAAKSLVVVMIGAIVVGTIANATIYHPTFHADDDHEGHTAVGHTHAFDGFGHSAALASGTRLWQAAWAVVAASSSVPALTIVGLLVALGLFGGALRADSVRANVAGWLYSVLPDSAGAAWSKPLTKRWVAALAGVGMLILAFIAMYAYFPPPTDVLQEMQVVGSDALNGVRANSSDVALERLKEWENLSTKLPIGALIRGQGSADRRIIAQQLRQSLVDLQRNITSPQNGVDLTLMAQQSDELYRQTRDVYSGKSLAEVSSDHMAMPSGVGDEAERELYLKPGGIYTEADIEANGRQTASQKYATFRAAHVMNPPKGSRICPVTFTLANPKCSWVVAGKTYEFCCPPCIDEFVTWAKETPEQIKAPETYVKQ